VRTLALIMAGALALAAPAAALGQSATASASPDAPADALEGLVATASLAGGVEAGLEHGKAGLLELELLAGWEIPSTVVRTGFTVRPEIALALGSSPDSHVAFRPGLRVSIPETPLWLRAAGDWSNARGKDPRWRWVLVGVAWEVRVTSYLGLSLEADTGVPLSGSAGLPLLLRAGATFRP
jgi:hypothetical protein